MGTASRLTTTIAAGALLAASTLPSLAASPSINDIDALGLPELSAAEASEVRGENIYTAAQIMYYAFVRWGIPLSVNTAASISRNAQPGTLGKLKEVLKSYGYNTSGSGGGGGSW